MALRDEVSAALATNDPLDPWLTESHWDDSYWTREAGEITSALRPAMTVIEVRKVVVTVLSSSIPPAASDDGTDKWRTARLDAIAQTIWQALRNT